MDEIIRKPTATPIHNYGLGERTDATGLPGRQINK